jgi:hypothetical protein
MQSQHFGLDNLLMILELESHEMNILNKNAAFKIVDHD